jgi:uncharacterized membrane protein HdeD (DUF308 family)
MLNALAEETPTRAAVTQAVDCLKRVLAPESLNKQSRLNTRYRATLLVCWANEPENLMNAETTVGAARKASGWSMLWGILMFICGILAISLPLASSIGVVLVLAWLILFAGIAHLIFAFQCHGIGAFVWQVLLAVAYGIAGIYMLMNPLLGVVSLTLVLAVFLLFEGIVELALYFRIRRVRHAGWILFDGIVTLFLGILIWAQWPSSSLWIIGTLIGISLIFSGISRVMLSVAIRRLSAA